MSNIVDFIEGLNDYAGLFSLLAVLAAVFVPFIIYKKEQKSERQAMKDMLNSLYKDYPSSKNNFQLMLRNHKQVDIFQPENDDEEDIQERIMP